MNSKMKSHRSFGIVLAGGGARGFSHAGVLRGLHHLGYTPSVVVGVSMGAVVGATYALNDNWYHAIRDMDLSGFPSMPNMQGTGLTAAVRKFITAERMMSDLYFGWGFSGTAEQGGRDMIAHLTLGQPLENARVPLFVCATDVATGERVTMDHGSTVNSVYASSAIAGVLPPATIDARLLFDGGYADIAPIDVARSAGVDIVIAVNPAGDADISLPRNGVETMMRSVEICQNHHALLRYAAADLTLAPEFLDPIRTLDFKYRRRAIAAGVRCTRAARSDLEYLLARPTG